MRILQVIHSFPPYFVSGSELYTAQLARLFSSFAEVFVFHRVSDPTVRNYELVEDEHSGIKIFKINCTRERYYLDKDFYDRNQYVEEKFKMILERIRPHIVHFQHLTHLSTALVEETARRKIPIVFTLHDYWLMCPQIQLLDLTFTVCDLAGSGHCYNCFFLKKDSTKMVLGKFLNKLEAFCPEIKYPISPHHRFINRVFNNILCILSNKNLQIEKMKERNDFIKKMISLVDIFIAPSSLQRELFIKFGIPEEKIIYSKYGIDTSQLRLVRKKPSSLLRFGFLGNFIPQKGVHILVKAFNRIEARGVSLKIYGGVPVYGDYLYEEWVRNFSYNSNISFEGRYRHNNISEILSGIDVLVVPSIWFETGPLTILEAFATKTPVIASDLGGMAELVRDGENGFLFKAGSIEDLVRKIKFVIEHPFLVDRWKKNIARVKTIEENAKEIEGIYKNLLKKDAKKEFVTIYPSIENSFLSPRPNILIITLDSLRADHLGCYGYRRNTSPFIDKLAQNGVLFNQAISASTATFASIPTIMTSLYPKNNGIYDFYWDVESQLELPKIDQVEVDILIPNIINIGEILKKNGYLTAYFTGISTVELLRTNFEKGFDKFIVDGNAKLILNNLVKGWLNSMKKKPFFLWIHYVSPHGPYSPPSPYNSLFLQEEPLFAHKIIRLGKNRFYGDNSIPKYIERDGIRDVDFYISQYDGEIRYVDDKIRELCQFIKDNKLDKNTLIILTSDHGEFMGEHNLWFSHGGKPYEPVIRVPLIISYKKLPKDIVIDRQVSLIDVMPTILDICGIRIPKNIDGKSLLPLIKEKKVNFQERRLFVEFKHKFGGFFTVALRDSNWKLTYSQYSKKDIYEYELYNLRKDPQELTNLVEVEKEIFASLKKELEDYMNRPALSVSQKGEFDNKTIEKLKSLGYL